MPANKVILEFDTTTEWGRKSAKAATQADDLQSAIWEISQEIFRPHRKHGYPAGNNNIPNLDDWTERELKIVGALEDMFYNILKDRGLENEPS